MLKFINQPINDMVEVANNLFEELKDTDVSILYKNGGKEYIRDDENLSVTLYQSAKDENKFTINIVTNAPVIDVVSDLAEAICAILEVKGKDIKECHTTLLNEYVSYVITNYKDYFNFEDRIKAMEVLNGNSSK